MKITPCVICQSTEREPGGNWKAACPKHEVVYNICFSSVSDGILSAKHASLEDLYEAFLFDVHRKDSRKSLRVALARELRKRQKAKEVQA